MLEDLDVFLLRDGPIPRAWALGPALLGFGPGFSLGPAWPGFTQYLIRRHVGYKRQFKPAKVRAHFGKSVSSLFLWQPVDSVSCIDKALE